LLIAIGQLNDTGNTSLQECHKFTSQFQTEAFGVKLVMWMRTLFFILPQLQVPAIPCMLTKLNITRPSTLVKITKNGYFTMHPSRAEICRIWSGRGVSLPGYSFSCYDEDL